MKRTRTHSILLSAFALLCAVVFPAAGNLVITNGGVSNITRLSSIPYGYVTGTNGTTNAISLILYWGQTDYTTNGGSWTYSNAQSIVTQAVPITVTNLCTNLAASTHYYCRWFAAQGTNSAWASLGTNYYTLTGVPTGAAPVVFYTPVMVDSNGVLVSPTNFLSTNGVAFTNDTAALSYTQGVHSGQIASLQDRAATNESSITGLSITQGLATAAIAGLSSTQTLGTAAIIGLQSTQALTAATAHFASNGVDALNANTNALKNMANQTNWADAVVDGNVNWSGNALTNVGNFVATNSVGLGTNTPIYFVDIWGTNSTRAALRVAGGVNDGSGGGTPRLGGAIQIGAAVADTAYGSLCFSSSAGDFFIGNSWNNDGGDIIFLLKGVSSLTHGTRPLVLSPEACYLTKGITSTNNPLFIAAGTNMLTLGTNGPITITGSVVNVDAPINLDGNPITNLNYLLATNYIVVGDDTGTNYATAGSLRLEAGTTTNQGIWFGKDNYIYRTSASTLTLSGNLILGGQNQATLFAAPGATRDTIFGLGTASRRYLFYDASGSTPLLSITNNAGAVTFGTGPSSATATNALEIGAGTNLMTLGQGGPLGITGSIVNIYAPMNMFSNSITNVTHLYLSESSLIIGTNRLYTTNGVLAVQTGTNLTEYASVTDLTARADSKAGKTAAYIVSGYDASLPNARYLDPYTLHDDGVSISVDPRIEQNIDLLTFDQLVRHGISDYDMADGYVNTFRNTNHILHSGSWGQYWIASSNYYHNVLDTVPATECTPYAHWKANDNAANTTVDDSIGANDLIAPSNTTILTQSGKINTALIVGEPVPDHGIYTSATNAWEQHNITISCWFNQNAGTDPILVFYGSEEFFYQTALYIHLGTSSGGDHTLVIGNGINFLDKSSTGVWTNNVWAHFAVTRTDSIVKGYINGNLVVTKSSGVLPIRGLGGLYFGGGAFSGGNEGHMKLDDIRFYSSVLTDAQIALIYNGGTGTETSTLGAAGVAGATNNMTLRGTNFITTFVPSSIKMDVWQSTMGTGETVNTDFKGWVSRDGGTTFTNVTLELANTFQPSSTSRMYSGIAVVTNLPLGSNIVQKVTVTNNMPMKIHGMGWTSGG